MKILSISVFTMAVIAPIYSFFASPAATQSWVKNYVSTNSTASVSMTNAVKRSEIVMAGSMATVMQILENDTSTNAVRNAANAAINAASPIVKAAMEGCVR